MTSTSTMPIAIIGMGCRFAGEVSSPEKLWKLCADAKSAWSEFPASRFNKDAFYHPNGQKLNSLNVQGGHFLSEDVALFDANFFGFTSELASVYDPQFRLQLELTYEALENAGLTMRDVAGSNTSVFAGAFFHDYSEMHMRDPETLPRALLVSTGAAMASNRLSHFYDLRGASQTIDTGCSTTLTAFHQACQSIHSGDSDMSIISASNIILNPDNFMVMSNAFLSEAGKSYAFDQRASGYGRGEGSATVIIKRLDYALRDGDPIRAVVRATAINQDGRTETITTPSRHAQATLIRECYRKAGLDPDDTTYFEAHGTGTPVGDPIEAAAIASAFSGGGERNDVLSVGSVKTNIGHTETVSGLASIIKVVMALQNKQIPPNANFEMPNPAIPFKLYRIKVPTSLETWIGKNGVYRASINNFGYGGANAHVILEDYASYSHSRKQTLPPSYLPSLQISSPRSRIFTLSAKDEVALAKMESQLVGFLRSIQPNCEETYLDDLAYTLGQRRSRLPWVRAYHARSIPELVKNIDAAQTALSRQRTQAPRIAYVMTGQGAQSWDMGRALIEAYPVYKQTIIAANEHLKNLGCTWDVLTEMTKNSTDTRVNELALSTPLSAILQIGLVELLRSWGISPVALCSHSSGEVAAAYASGALTLKDAMAVVFARGQIAGTTIPGEKRGAMIATGLGPMELEHRYLSRLPKGSVVVACLNSPSSTTASGDADAIEQLERMLAADNVFGRRLRIDCAYHSHHMEALSPTYRNYLEGRIKGDGVINPSIVYSSPTTGQRETDGAQISLPKHWVESFARPVQFTKALRSMCFESEDSKTCEIDVIIEIGPHSALGGPIQETIAQSDYHNCKIRYLPTLVRKANAVDTMHALACELMEAGISVNMGALNFPCENRRPKVLHDLPTYPWNHQKVHWSEPRINRAHRHRLYGDHDLLGSLVLGTNMLSPTWRHVLRLSDLPWLRDHVIQTDVVFPAAGYVSMAIEACRQVAQTKHQVSAGYHFRNIEISSALVIPDNAEGIEIQMTFTPPSPKAIYDVDYLQFRVYSVSHDGDWNEHCKGLVKTDIDSEGSGGDQALARSSPKWNTPLHSYRKILTPSDVYAALQDIEIRHGLTFQNLTQVRASGNEAAATFTVADTAAVQPQKYQHEHVVHPTTLDVLFQLAYANYIALADADMSVSFVPRTIKSLYVSASISSLPGHTFRAYSDIVGVTTQSFTTNMSVVDHTSRNLPVVPVMSIEHYTTRSIGTKYQPADTYQKLAKISWQPDVTFCDNQRLRDLVCSPDDANLVKAFDRRQRLCLAHITKAVAEISARDVRNMRSCHKYMYYWMLMHIENTDTQLLRRDYEDVQKSSLVRCHTPEQPQESGLDSLIHTIGPQLASILKGHIELSSIASQPTIIGACHNPTVLQNCVQKVATYLRLLAHKKPKLRILHLFDRDAASALMIARSFDVDIRDAIASFEVSDASGRSIEHVGTWDDLLTINNLDIERNLDAQNFSSTYYDVVLVDRASCTIKSPSKSLANIKRLLKHDGTLMLTDEKRNLLEQWLMLGLLPERWQQDQDSTLEPARSTQTWAELLCKAGFNGIDKLMFDSEHEDHHSMRIMVSTPATSMSSTTFAPVVLVTTSDTLPLSWLSAISTALAAIVGAEPTIESIFDVRPDGRLCVFLGDTTNAFLKDSSPEEFEAIKNLCVRCKGLLWITSGASMESSRPESSLTQGFLRTLRTEDASKRAISLDLDPSLPMGSTSWISSITQVFKSCFDYEQPIDEFEYAVRNDFIHVPRYYRDYERNKMFEPLAATTNAASLQTFGDRRRRLQLVVRTPGLLDSLAFAALDDAYEVMQAGIIEIQPRAFGVNLRDVLSAMGQLTTSTMGFECAGIVTRVSRDAFAAGFAPGDRVAALTDGGYSNAVRIGYTSVTHIPDSLTYEMAASIPKCYTAAYICLVDIARLQKHETVLIHAAAGGFGQAAITISQFIGAKIFVTVSNAEKRDLLATHHSIPPEQIYDSRSKSFVSSIMEATDGRGVDVVLNNLSGALLQESLNCAARFGRVVDVGKKDFESDNCIHSGCFARSVTFTSFDLVQYQTHRGVEVHRALTAVMKMVEEQQLSLIHPVNVHPLSEIETTFRLLQSGRQIGKQVISVAGDEKVEVIPFVPKIKLRSDASYLVVGGLGGLGRTICEWLISRGARNLIIMSRSATAEKIVAFSSTAAQLGCRVHASRCDIADRESVQNAFDDCAKHMPAIRGVIQGAMVLQDSLLERMTHEQWKGAVQPKVQGSWNLHERLHSKDIDFFVLLSSLSGIVGLPTQCNYAAGNSYQDALAKFRSSQGLHAAAIDIGVVQAVGVVADNEKLASGLKHWKPVTEKQVLQVIESAILSPPSEPMLIGINGAHWSVSGLDRDRRFAILEPKDTAVENMQRSNNKHGELAAAISSAFTFDDACVMIVTAIGKQLVQIFMLREDEVDPSKPLIAWGVDSLSAVEIRNMLTLRAGADVSIFEIMQASSIQALAEVVAAKSSYLASELVPKKE